MKDIDQPVHFRDKESEQSTTFFVIFWAITLLWNCFRLYFGVPQLIENIELISQFKWWWGALKVFTLPIVMFCFTYLFYFTSYNCPNFVVFESGLFFPYNKVFIEWKNIKTIYGSDLSSTGEIFARKYLKLPLKWKQKYSENDILVSLVNAKYFNKPLMLNLSWTKEPNQDQPKDLKELRSFLENKFVIAGMDFNIVNDMRSPRHQWIYLRRWYLAIPILILFVMLYPKR